MHGLSRERSGRWSRLLLDRRTLKRRDQGRLEVFDFVEGFYNPRRRHSALGYVSPDQFEEKELTAVAV